jgi:hypothetical protein
MLKKLVFKGQQRTQLLIAGIGSVIGLFIVLGAVQLYYDITSAAFGGKDLLKDGFVMQKKITAVNTLSLGSSSFTPTEIDELSQQEFTEEVSPVLSTRFKVATTVGREGGSIPQFYIDMFFQAIPDKYLDVAGKNFNWKPGDSLIPIILPVDYLNLYNYGFAPSQGIPQLSEDAFSVNDLTVIVSGNGYRETYRGRITGFTAKISTILVPESFIRYGNEKFSSPEEAQVVDRLFIVVNARHHNAFEKFIAEKSYTVDAEKLKTSEQKSRLQLALYVLLLVAGLIILQSILIFIQYAQLFISRAGYEIRLLIQLGYFYKVIAAAYVRYFVIIFSVVTVVTVVIAVLAKVWANNYFQSSLNIQIEGSLDWTAYVIALGFLAVYSLVIRISVYRIIKRMAGRN